MPASSSSSGRLARRYAQAAVLFLNTVLVGAIGLVAIHFIMNTCVPARPSTYSALFNLDSYTLIDRQTALAVGHEFDQMGEGESYAFNP